jgi:hypothetical protein
MEDAVAIRRVAIGAVDDVEPLPLRATIERHIADGSMVPGMFTLQAVRATADGSAPATDGDLPEPIANRAAGVQLIYDGLRLTRRLAQDEPWTTGSGDTADIEILAADIMVARGFYLLARTKAAGAAVEVVRSFGNDQTVSRETDDPSLDRNLEADVLELAVVAGATVAGGAVPPILREHAAELAVTPFPEPADFFAETDPDALSAMAADPTGSEGVTTVGDQ